jgi:hypothetical protein
LAGRSPANQKSADSYSFFWGEKPGRGAGVKTDFSGARPSGRFNVRKLKVVEKIGRHGALGVEAV